jgi:hypothetical protein
MTITLLKRSIELNPAFLEIIRSTTLLKTVPKTALHPSYIIQGIYHLHFPKCTSPIVDHLRLTNSTHRSTPKIAIYPLSVVHTRVDRNTLPTLDQPFYRRDPQETINIIGVFGPAGASKII